MILLGWWCLIILRGRRHSLGRRRLVRLTGHLRLDWLLVLLLVVLVLVISLRRAIGVLVLVGALSGRWLLELALRRVVLLVWRDVFLGLLELLGRRDIVHGLSLGDLVLHLVVVVGGGRASAHSKASLLAASEVSHESPDEGSDEEEPSHRSVSFTDFSSKDKTYQTIAPRPAMAANMARPVLNRTTSRFIISHDLLSNKLPSSWQFPTLTA